jgi:hypothetical protein
VRLARLSFAGGKTADSSRDMPRFGMTIILGIFKITPLAGSQHYEVHAILG